MHLGGNRRWVPLNFVVKSFLVPVTHTQSASVVSYKFHQEALTMTTFLVIFGEALL